MRVSELVTIEEINKWKQGDIITIKAGTGKGKSYFIKNNLYAIAKRDNKKILMLIHRKNCTDQFKMEIKKDDKTDIISIKTYQSIEAVVKNKIDFELDQYDYLIMDEWHYFLSDSAFNQYTDLSLDAILGQTKAIRIFMSATDDRMKRYLTDIDYKGLTTIDYVLPIDFNFIRRLEFFYNDETFETYIEEAISLNKKAIFFISSASKAYRLHEKYKKYTLFNCGKGSKFYKHVDEEKIKMMLKNEKFEELILITTTVMDAGVNIVDDELNHIVADVKDAGTLIQCIGRKRLKSKDDYIILHVKTIGSKQLRGMETQVGERLKLGTYFLEHGEKKLVDNNYRRLNDNLIYDETTATNIEKRLNTLMFFRFNEDQKDIQLIKSYGKEAYCNYIAKEVFNINSFNIHETDRKNDSLEAFLDNMVGKPMLQAKDREDLINNFNVRDGRNNRILKGIDTLNGMLKENNFDYILEQFRTSKQTDGKRKYYDSAWRVRRLSDY